MPLLSRWFGRSWTPAWGALAIALVAILVGFSPARTWAERLLATLRAAGISHSEDPSNRDPRFTRSRLRELMPHLAREGLNANGLWRFAARMRRADRAID